MVQRKTIQDRLGRSLGPEMMKRPRPSKLPQPTTPEKQTVAKVTSGSPNYMKGTSSSEARRQDQSVHAGSDKKRQSGKKLDSCSGDKKQSSRSSSGRSLKKGQSFKRSYRISHCWDVNAHRSTCSSLLKDSKFTECLMLTPPGVMKLCPYTYCSLNAHIHREFPPLKSFISARRRFLKSHASVKMSGVNGCVDVYADKKKENGRTREIDIQVISSEPETMEMEWGEAEDLESESAEMVSLLEGEGIESCGSGDENICMLIENFAILEKSGISSEDQESEEGSFSDNSISFLLSEQSIIQDNIILGNALDEKVTFKKAQHWEGDDGEKETELLSRTEETLLTLAQKRCKREECIEDWRKFNPREPKYLPIIAEPSSERVELKHQDMDERNNPEEWMIDYSLQHTVSKLALERKKKVVLLIEAFETILPTEPSQAFTYGRHLQACN